MRSTMPLAAVLLLAVSILPFAAVAADPAPGPETKTLATASFNGSGWFAVRYQACDGPVLLNVTTTDLSPALATGLFVLDGKTLDPSYGLIRNSLTGSGNTASLRADPGPTKPIEFEHHDAYTTEETIEETAELTPEMHGGTICGTYVMAVFVAADHLASMEMAFRAPPSAELLGHASGEDAFRLTARDFEKASASAYAQATLPVLETQRGTLLAPAMARASLEATHHLEIDGTLIGYYGDSPTTTGADLLAYDGPAGHRECGRLSNLPEGVSPSKCIWLFFDQDRRAPSGSYTFTLTGAGAGSQLTGSEVYLIAADIVLP